MDWSAFVGLPWRDRGRELDGMDCWGLVVSTFAAGPGIKLPSHAEEYRTAADARETAQVLAGEVGDWIAVEERTQRAFDVVVMRIAGRLHVGLVVRPGLLLHMPVNKTSVIEPLSRFAPVLDGIYRHKRLA